jgi:hypothetical protein
MLPDVNAMNSFLRPAREGRWRFVKGLFVSG